MSLLASIDPRRSLRARFAGILGGCGLAFALSGALLVGGYERDQVQQGLGQGLRREAELLGRTLSITLQDQLLLVRQLASLPVLASGLMPAGETRLLLEQRRGQQPALMWLAVTDAKGRVRVATGSLLEGQDLSAEPWFTEGLKQPWIGERRPAGRLAPHVPLARDGQMAQLIDLAAPLVDYQGRTVGVVVARLAWSWLDELHSALYAEGHRSPGTDSLVLDRLGLVSIGPAGLLGRPLAVPGLRRLLDGDAPAVLTWPDGQRYLTALARDDGLPGPSAGLKVVVRQRDEDAFGQARQLGRQLIAGGVAAALVFMALSIWLAGRIARPVKALSDAAERMARGQPPRFAPVPAQRRDEVAGLAAAMRTLHDELQQRLAEQQRSTLRFQALFEGAPVAIYLSVDGQLVLANTACLQLFGAADLAELRGKRTTDLIHPEERALLERRIQRMRELQALNQPIPMVEQRILRLDGGVRDVELTALPLDLDGAHGTHVALRDITDRKRTAQALAESEDRLQLVLRGTGAAVWDWVAGSQSLYLSPTWSALLGLAEGHLPAGRDQWTARLHADDRDRVVAELEDLAAGHTDRLQTEFRVYSEVGVERSLLVRAFLVRDAAGQPLRMMGSASDISEIREARRLLQQREALLQQTSRMAKVGGWSVDLVAQTAEWTEEINRMYELPSDTRPSLAVMAQSLGATWPQLWGTAQQAIDAASPYDIETSVAMPSGQIKWLRVQGTPVFEGGRAVRLEGTTQDVTDRHQAEDAVRVLNAELEARVLARTAQLRAANAELDAFAYAVSHDLRAPLRAMSGFSQALLEDCGPQLDSEARLYLDQIIQASSRMGGLIDGLLTLSRSTRGELRSDEVNLSALALRALADLRAADPQREVQVDIEPDLMVSGDGRMLDAVVRNLIGNAWKYTGRQPQAHITLASVQREGQRWIEVRDNGAGFDMAHAGRLFKAFARLHRQDEFAGIGIGLATVQRIVQRHGGSIEAESQPGQGAVFRFTLPGPGAQPVPALTDERSSP